VVLQLHELTHGLMYELVLERVESSGRQMVRWLLDKWPNTVLQAVQTPPRRYSGPVQLAAAGESGYMMEDVLWGAVLGSSTEGSKAGCKSFKLLSLHPSKLQGDMYLTDDVRVDTRKQVLTLGFDLQLPARNLLAHAEGRAWLSHTVALLSKGDLSEMDSLEALRMPEQFLAPTRQVEAAREAWLKAHAHLLETTVSAAPRGLACRGVSSVEVQEEEEEEEEEQEEQVQTHLGRPRDAMLERRRAEQRPDSVFE